MQTVPFFWVVNVESSLRFYVDGLGFTIARKWVEGAKLRWCWLEREGAALMLQEFKADGRHAVRLEGKCGEGMAIYFICEDAIALFREFASRGIVASRPVVGNGMWVTELTDPDGFRLAFESVTVAPEESRFDAHL
jgi:lactoylglutathione lyase